MTYDWKFNKNKVRWEVFQLNKRGKPVIAFVAKSAHWAKRIVELLNKEE